MNEHKCSNVSGIQMLNVKQATHLTVDDDWAVDRGAQDGVAQTVEVAFQRSGRVADRDALKTIFYNQSGLVKYPNT